MTTLPQPSFIAAYYELRRQLTDAPAAPHTEADVQLVRLMDEALREGAAKIRSEAETWRDGWPDKTASMLYAADLIDPDRENT